MNNRNLKLICLDSLASTLSLYLAFLLRFEFVIPERFFDSFTSWVVVFVLVQAFVFYFSGLYARIWRYTSIFDLFAITRSSIIAFALSIIVIFVITGSSGYPRSVLLLYLILSLVSVLAIRLSARIYFTHYQKREVHIKSQSKRKKLLLIGAGEIGDKIAREILTTGRNKYELIGFVDDNIIKKGALLHGKEVLGSVSDLPHLKISYNELLITFSNASGDEMRRIIGFCKETGKRYKTVPGIHELIDGEVMLDRIRDVSYSDLLGREEVVLDINSLDNMFHGKRVLISGAGGSIGSELVSQCLKFSPAEIICIEVNEEKIHSLEEFSKTVNPKTVIKTILASVNNKKECEKVFLDNRPHIVFHAAAYKHVPIQEIHPWKAVSTNLGGTLNLVELSDKYKVHKFVLVSTDKAVNPVNIMGATKRAAEKLIQSFNPHTSTKLMAVRFGNVLGSSGSAIPTFQKQINDGGPLTITHPEMTRYFMSIQEASQLILQSCAIGRKVKFFF